MTLPSVVLVFLAFAEPFKSFHSSRCGSLLGPQYYLNIFAIFTMLCIINGGSVLKELLKEQGFSMTALIFFFQQNNGHKSQAVHLPQI